MKQKKTFVELLMKYYENGYKLDYKEVEDTFKPKQEGVEHDYLFEYDAGVFALQGVQSKGHAIRHFLSIL